MRVGLFHSLIQKIHEGRLSGPIASPGGGGALLNF